MDIDKIKTYLQVIRRAVDLIEQSLQENRDVSKEFSNLVSQATTVISDKQNVVQKSIPSNPPEFNIRQAHIDKILSLSHWPKALPDHMICTPSEEDKIDGANAIIQMLIDMPLNGINFLDFGCGEGWVANEIMEKGVKTSTGYDIKTSEVWDKFEKPIFTSDYESLTKGFYDVILLFDVLDHCLDAVDVMNKVKELLSPNGVVYIRCHPWTSPHGGHLHKVGLNKAYIHLFITETELLSKGFSPIFVRHEVSPVEAYRWWFKDFKINLERFIKSDELDPFFLNPTFQKLVFEEQKINENDHRNFLENMKIKFIDYVLTNG